METFLDRIALLENEKTRISTFTYEKLLEQLEDTGKSVLFNEIDQYSAVDCVHLENSSQKITNDLGVALENPLRIRLFSSEDLGVSPENDMRVVATVYIGKEGTVIQTSSSFDEDGNEYKNYRDLNILEQNGLFEDARRYFNIT